MICFSLFLKNSFVNCSRKHCLKEYLISMYVSKHDQILSSFKYLNSLLINFFLSIYKKAAFTFQLSKERLTMCLLIVRVIAAVRKWVHVAFNHAQWI